MACYQVYFTEQEQDLRFYGKAKRVAVTMGSWYVTFETSINEKLQFWRMSLKPIHLHCVYIALSLLWKIWRNGEEVRVP